MTTKSTNPIEPIAPSKPRWACEISDENWLRLNRLVEDGISAPAILRKIKIPMTKTRSLQLYARNFAARRRIANFETFKNAVVNAGVKNAQNFCHAYQHMIRLVSRKDVDDRTRVRAFEAVTLFARSLNNFMKSDLADQRNHDTEYTTTEDVDRRNRLIEVLKSTCEEQLRARFAEDPTLPLGPEDYHTFNAPEEDQEDEASEEPPNE